MPEDTNKVATPIETETEQNSPVENSGVKPSNEGGTVNNTNELETLKEQLLAEQNKNKMNQIRFENEKAMFQKQLNEKIIENEKIKQVEEQVSDEAIFNDTTQKVKEVVNTISEESEDLKFIRQQRINARKMELLNSGFSVKELEILVEKLGGEENLIQNAGVSVGNLLSIVQSMRQTNTEQKPISEQSNVVGLKNQAKSPSTEKVVSVEEFQKNADSIADYLVDEIIKDSKV